MTNEFKFWATFQKQTCPLWFLGDYILIKTELGRTKHWNAAFLTESCEACTSFHLLSWPPGSVLVGFLESFWSVSHSWRFSKDPSSLQVWITALFEVLWGLKDFETSFRVCFSPALAFLKTTAWSWSCFTLPLYKWFLDQPVIKSECSRRNWIQICKGWVEGSFCFHRGFVSFSTLWINPLDETGTCFCFKFPYGCVNYWFLYEKASQSSALKFLLVFLLLFKSSLQPEENFKLNLESSPKSLAAAWRHCCSSACEQSGARADTPQSSQLLFPAG